MNINLSVNLNQLKVQRTRMHNTIQAHTQVSESHHRYPYKKLNTDFEMRKTPKQKQPFDIILLPTDQPALIYEIKKSGDALAVLISPYTYPLCHEEYLLKENEFKAFTDDNGQYFGKTITLQLWNQCRITKKFLNYSYRISHIKQPSCIKNLNNVIYGTTNVLDKNLRRMGYEIPIGWDQYKIMARGSVEMFLRYQDEERYLTNDKLETENEILKLYLPKVKRRLEDLNPVPRHLTLYEASTAMLDAGGKTFDDVLCVRISNDVELGVDGFIDISKTIPMSPDNERSIAVPIEFVGITWYLEYNGGMIANRNSWSHGLRFGRDKFPQNINNNLAIDTLTKSVSRR